jgi:hypothetical protein
MISNPNTIGDEKDAKESRGRPVQFGGKPQFIDQGIKAIHDMHEYILKDQTVAPRDIQILNQAVGELPIGSTTLGTLLSHPNTKECLDILKLLEEDFIENTDIAQLAPKILFLTDVAAVKLAKINVRGLELSALESITDKQTAALAKFKGDRLFLDKLTSLTDAQAAALARYKGNFLSLDGVTSLNDAQLDSLLKFNGYTLYLNGLTSLTERQMRMIYFKRFRVSLPILIRGQIETLDPRECL